MSDFSDDISIPVPPEPPMPPLTPSQSASGETLPKQPVQAQMPVGSIIAYAGKVAGKGQGPDPTKHVADVVPMGWMVCDGRSLYIAEYPQLFEAIGNLYGEDGQGTFKVPDYRGYFLRCIGTDEGSREERKAAPKGEPDGVGSTQEDAVLTHAHDYQLVSEQSSFKPGGPEAFIPPSKPKPTGGPVSYLGGSLGEQVSQYETRPKNVNVYYLIKCF